MSKSITIAVGSYFERLIEQQISQGRYNPASEVVIAGLRLLERDEVHLELLRKALIDGETSGLATPFDFDAFLEERHREYRERNE